jgi:hypothetical protein
MKQLSEEAKKHLDKYLKEVKSCLEICASVDSKEIHQDIIEHIERELESVEEPVSYDEIDNILRSLGPPRQWVPQEEEVSWWRKAILRLRKGPEDWRLAYISFGLLLIALLIERHKSFWVIFSFPLFLMRGTAQGFLLLAS